MQSARQWLRDSWWRPLLVLPALLGSCLLIAGGPLAEGAGAATTNRPNILIFLTDDQRAAGSMIEMPAVRRVFDKEERGSRTAT